MESNIEKKRIVEIAQRGVIKHLFDAYTYIVRQIKTKGEGNMKHMISGLVMKKWGSKMVVDWAKVVEFNVDGHDVKVISNETIVKVSKSGKERKERRLTVTIDGIHSIEVGTESIKKGSFINRLLRETMVIEEPTEEVEEQPSLEEIMKNWERRVEKEGTTEIYRMLDDESEFDIDELERMVGFDGAKEYP